MAAAAAAAAAAARLRIGDVPRFAADGSVSWFAFSTQLQAMLVGGAVAEEQRVLYLNAAFTGKASDTVLAIYGEGGIPVDAVFHEVMEQLTPIFAPPETPQAQHQRFAQLRLDRFASVALGVDAFNKALALQPLTPERRWLYFLEFLENCPLLVMEFNRQFPVDEPPPAFAVALQALLKLQDLFQAGAMLGPRGGAPVPVLAVHTAAEATIAALEPSPRSAGAWGSGAGS